jgi:AcrR family transcriptional regulator
MPVDRIIDAAVELVDEVGPGEFSMRLLAQRLQSSTATLYRHFAGKDEILVQVVDHVLGEVPRHFPHIADTSSWQERLVASAEALFRTLRKHPKVVSLFDNHIPLGPRALAGREAAIGIMLAGGFSPEVAARAYTATVTSASFLPSSLDDEFHFGLQLLVDGLANHLPHPTGSAFEGVAELE